MYVLKLDWGHSNIGRYEPDKNTGLTRVCCVRVKHLLLACVGGVTALNGNIGSKKNKKKLALKNCQTNRDDL